MILNVYCDESCHILKDGSNHMGFGAISINKKNCRSVAVDIKKIKRQYNCNGELKWVKVSPKNITFYKKLIDYFFESGLAFRVLIVENKKLLNHEYYNHGSHESFYYKMYYQLLVNILRNKKIDAYNIYLDIKDTHGSLKTKKLKEILANTFFDFNFNTIQKIQIVRSHEVELLQIADFLMGAVMYKSRNLKKSTAKLELANYIQKKSNYNLLESTPPWEEKFNIFHFSPKKKENNSNE